MAVNVLTSIFGVSSESISRTLANLRHLLETRLTKAKLHDIFGLEAGGPQHLLHAQQHSQRELPRAATSLTCRESLPGSQFTADIQATAPLQKAATSVAAPVQRLSGLHDPIEGNPRCGPANRTPTFVRLQPAQAIERPSTVRLQLVQANVQAPSMQQEVIVSLAAAEQQSEVSQAEHQPSPTMPLPNNRSAKLST